MQRNLPGVISVFVLPPGEPAMAAAPRPTAGTLRDVFRGLSARTLLGSELYVLSPQFQPISIAVSLEVVEPGNRAAGLPRRRAGAARLPWPLPPHGRRGKGWPRGRSIEINELRTQAGRVNGVEAVDALRLFHQDLTTLAWLELSDRQALPLTDYQLPELMAVRCNRVRASPYRRALSRPGGLALPGSAGSPGSSGGRAVPVPVTAFPTSAEPWTATVPAFCCSPARPKSRAARQPVRLGRRGRCADAGAGGAAAPAAPAGR